MPINKETATPPMIGKIGPYTVFVTPPPTPKSSFESSPPSVKSSSPIIQPPSAKSAPPVLAPPVQYEKSASAYDSKFGFFWDFVSKVQNAHSSLDDHVARWFGLNQSKYQWALDDYYEKKGMVGFKFDSLNCRIRLMEKLKMYPPKHKVREMLLTQDQRRRGWIVSRYDGRGRGQGRV